MKEAIAEGPSLLHLCDGALPPVAVVFLGPAPSGDPPLHLNQSDVIEGLGPLPPWWLSGFTERPMATLTTRFPPERLEAMAVGESLVEVLMLSVQTGNATRSEPLAVRFTRESPERVRVTNAERVALDGRELMADPTLRSVMLLLGYERIGDEVPVSLDALLARR
ncbi:hypothetical protein QC758_05655 [Halomonas campisalis]|uniref:hypothetical protein n=1 Tax=Billgrantia campisalis TaxID=74661 RepID=UPI001EF1078B|nr:hypothetical protein [Halomonas campisalis]MDR5862448.1 hypothetical protein [Halomonas campisalis]